MAISKIKVDKRGSIVLPSKLRRQLGWGDGVELTIVVEGGEVRLRALAAQPVDDSPVWSAEETAYYILMNARTQEAWDASLPRVLELGIDPAGVAGIACDRRDTLPTREQWEASDGQLRAARLEALHRA